MMIKMNVGRIFRDINHNNEQNHAWKTHVRYIGYFIDDNVVICICFFITVILIDHHYLHLSYVLDNVISVVSACFALSYCGGTAIVVEVAMSCSKKKNLK